MSLSTLTYALTAADVETTEEEIADALYDCGFANKNEAAYIAEEIIYEGHCKERLTVCDVSYLSEIEDVVLVNGPLEGLE